MNIPAELKYTNSHEWVQELEGGKVRIGITDFAQSSLGGIVFVELPQIGDTVTAGEPFADVESVKAVSEIFSPVSGAVCAVNETLLDAPELINENAYGAWLIEVESSGAFAELLDAAAYEAKCQEEQ